MSNIRIDNVSGDTVTVFLNGNSYVVQNGEKMNIEAVEKGSCEIRIHRTCIPTESENPNENTGGGIAEKVKNNEKNLHTQLDGIFNVDVNASKAVFTVDKKLLLKDKFGLDVIFSGYSLTVSGAKVENSTEVFANKSEKKKFILHHLKEAFVPVGLVGIIVLLVGIFALGGNIIGNVITVGGTKMTYPWSVGLLAAGLGFNGYTVIALVNSLKTARKYTEK